MKYTAFYTVILGCILAVTYVHCFSDQDLDLQQDGDQLVRITRRIHHEPWSNPRPPTFPRPTPTFPRPPSTGPIRYARSPVEEMRYPRDLSEDIEHDQLTRNARHAQWGPRPAPDRPLTPTFPQPSQFPRPSSFPGQFPRTPTSFPNRRFRRSALTEQDSELNFDEDQHDQLTRNARQAQWGPRPAPDRRLTPTFPQPSQFPRPSSFPGQFPRTPTSFPNRRFRRSALIEQDIELESDGDQLERVARNIHPGPRQRPRPSPTFPRPPSKPGRYARSPSKIYDANMHAPKVVRNFGGRRH
uniref:Venom protein family 9 protein 2 n=1 Tax=Pristhesancus plagipennis TaxID=1955184 RepID=A0A2K8JLN7_PRIPG|nr:venom protein family 9 protein 2 [Pristhesancus plagipennis]